MKKILFVDDEQDVLDGLANSLRRNRKQWGMQFALGANAALTKLAGERFDVVVSDMRMPGMDGAELLRSVKDLYPATARIILSGHAESQAVFRALPVAQQFISKPCDSQTIQNVIERTCSLQELLQEPKLKSIVGSLEHVPSVPAIYWKLTQALSSPNASLAEITRIVEQDPSICIKLLQLVNSSYFGVSHHVRSIQQAVAYLGLDLVRALALTAHIFSGPRSRMVDMAFIESLQESSLLTARVSKAIIGDTSKDADGAFTAGLVHDIGLVILGFGLPSQMARVMERVKYENIPLHMAELELLGVSHAEVGAYLLGMWGLPFSIVETVAYHHTPGKGASESCEVMAAVHVADAFVNQLFKASCAPTPDMPILDFEFLEKSGFASKLQEWESATSKLLSTCNRRGK
ncbi:MAG: HDOD domain-containing protein [Planctomycetes bacterium]|nr:HDOD domain-containing protein [Planctomycetota bacterium]